MAQVLPGTVGAGQPHCQGAEKVAVASSKKPRQVHFMPEFESTEKHILCIDRKEESVPILMQVNKRRTKTKAGKLASFATIPKCEEPLLKAPFWVTDGTQNAKRPFRDKISVLHDCRIMSEGCLEPKKDRSLRRRPSSTTVLLVCRH